MTPALLGIVVAAAAGFSAFAVLCCAVRWVWPQAGMTLTHWSAQRRADALAALRLTPAALGLAAAAVVLVAFVRLEPKNAREIPGIILVLLATSGVTVAARQLVSACREWYSTSRVVRSWSTEAITRTAQGIHVATIDASFPIVAVVGIVHPRLYVARTVVESCNDEELDAVIAHEAAHLKARDNLTRLLFLCAPTLFLRTFVEIEREWVRAAEEAADDRARTTTNASLALASALTKVARLASRQSAPLLHASAILSGSVVEARVRRLLDSEPEQTASFGTLRAGVGAGIGFVIGVGVFAQPWLYDVAEFCVRRLP